ncbi:MAG: hypothetical protein K6F64_01105 [Clostridia bacterium]|nr:hypothetical protein [Clostridia bacterium]
MRTIKKITAIILCFCLLVSTAAVIGYADDTESAAVTEAEKKESKADYPIIFVTGVGQSYSYFYKDPADAQEYYALLEQAQNDPSVNETAGADAKWNLFCNDFSFAFKEIGTYGAILSVVGGLLLSVLGHNFIPERSVNKLVKTLFRYNTIDEKGQLPENVITPRCYYPVSRYTTEQRENFYRTIPCEDIIGDIGEDMLYCFNYSAFSFTYDNSAALHDFINNSVLPQTGKDKVVLVPMSMGASVVSAYLQDYGTEGKVARVVSIVGAWDGSDVFADLIELAYAEDAPEKLYNGVVSDLVGEPWGYLVNIILRIFPKKTLRSIIDEILNSIVENLVLKTPSLLALIPKDRYPAIRASRLEGNEDLAYILEMTDKYYDCQCGLKDRLTMLHDSYGVDFFYIAGYGLGFGGYSSDYEFFSFLANADTTNSDEIISISSTATGATYAPHGTALSSYADENYVSPDKSVDISTCFFPDNVWLFYRQKHELENNNTALKLALSLSCGEIKSTTDEANIYPRFNDSRDLKRYSRSFKPDLEKWLETNTPTAEQQELIDSVSAKAKAVEDSVINNREEDDKIIGPEGEYYDMLVTLGVYEAPEESRESLGNKVLKGLNDRVYSIFGAKGFADIFRKNV